MKTLLVTVDTNDADYITEVVEVSEKDLERFLPLIEKIKNFKPYTVECEGRWGNISWSFNNNFPTGECWRNDLGEKHPKELYNLSNEDYEDFVEIFQLWGSEWGFHTIVNIQEITLGNKFL